MEGTSALHFITIKIDHEKLTKLHEIGTFLSSRILFLIDTSLEGMKMKNQIYSSLVAEINRRFHKSKFVKP